MERRNKICNPTLCYRLERGSMQSQKNFSGSMQLEIWDGTRRQWFMDFVVMTLNGRKKKKGNLSPNLLSYALAS